MGFQGTWASRCCPHLQQLASSLWGKKPKTDHLNKQIRKTPDDGGANSEDRGSLQAERWDPQLWKAEAKHGILESGALGKKYLWANGAIQTITTLTLPEDTHSKWK